MATERRRRDDAVDVHVDAVDAVVVDAAVVHLMFRVLCNCLQGSQWKSGSGIFQGLTLCKEASLSWK